MAFEGGRLKIVHAGMHNNDDKAVQSTSIVFSTPSSCATVSCTEATDMIPKILSVFSFAHKKSSRPEVNKDSCHFTSMGTSSAISCNKPLIDSAANNLFCDLNSSKGKNMKTQVKTKTSDMLYKIYTLKDLRSLLPQASNAVTDNSKVSQQVPITSNNNDNNKNSEKNHQPNTGKNGDSLNKLQSLVSKLSESLNKEKLNTDMVTNYDKELEKNNGDDIKLDEAELIAGSLFLGCSEELEEEFHSDSKDSCTTKEGRASFDVQLTDYSCSESILNVDNSAIANDDSYRKIMNKDKNEDKNATIMVGAFQQIKNKCSDKNDDNNEDNSEEPHFGDEEDGEHEDEKEEEEDPNDPEYIPDKDALSISDASDISDEECIEKIHSIKHGKQTSVDIVPAATLNLQRSSYILSAAMLNLRKRKLQHGVRKDFVARNTSMSSNAHQVKQSEIISTMVNTVMSHCDNRHSSFSLNRFNKTSVVLSNVRNHPSVNMNVGSLLNNNQFRRILPKPQITNRGIKRPPLLSFQGTIKQPFKIYKNLSNNTVFSESSAKSTATTTLTSSTQMRTSSCIEKPFTKTTAEEATKKEYNLRISRKVSSNSPKSKKYQLNISTKRMPKRIDLIETEMTNEDAAYSNTTCSGADSEQNVDMVVSRSYATLKVFNAKRAEERVKRNACMRNIRQHIVTSNPQKTATTCHLNLGSFELPHLKDGVTVSTPGTRKQPLVSQPEIQVVLDTKLSDQAVNISGLYVDGVPFVANKTQQPGVTSNNKRQEYVTELSHQQTNIVSQNLILSLTSNLSNTKILSSTQANVRTINIHSKSTALIGERPRLLLQQDKQSLKTAVPINPLSSVSARPRLGSGLIGPFTINSTKRTYFQKVEKYGTKLIKLALGSVSKSPNNKVLILKQTSPTATTATCSETNPVITTTTSRTTNPTTSQPVSVKLPRLTTIPTTDQNLGSHIIGPFHTSNSAKSAYFEIIGNKIVEVDSTSAAYASVIPTAPKELIEMLSKVATTKPTVNVATTTTTMNHQLATKLPLRENATIFRNLTAASSTKTVMAKAVLATTNQQLPTKMTQSVTREVSFPLQCKTEDDSFTSLSQENLTVISTFTTIKSEAASPTSFSATNTYSNSPLTCSTSKVLHPRTILSNCSVSVTTINTGTNDKPVYRFVAKIPTKDAPQHKSSVAEQNENEPAENSKRVERIDDWLSSLLKSPQESLIRRDIRNKNGNIPKRSCKTAENHMQLNNKLSASQRPLADAVATCNIQCETISSQAVTTVKLKPNTRIITFNKATTMDNQVVIPNVRDATPIISSNVKVVTLNCRSLQISSPLTTITIPAAKPSKQIPQNALKVHSGEKYQQSFATSLRTTTIVTRATLPVASISTTISTGSPANALSHLPTLDRITNIPVFSNVLAGNKVFVLTNPTSGPVQLSMMDTVNPSTTTESTAKNLCLRNNVVVVNHGNASSVSSTSSSDVKTKQIPIKFAMLTPKNICNSSVESSSTIILPRCLPDNALQRAAPLQPTTGVQPIGRLPANIYQSFGIQPAIIGKTASQIMTTNLTQSTTGLTFGTRTSIAPTKIEENIVSFLKHRQERTISTFSQFSAPETPINVISGHSGNFTVSNVSPITTPTQAVKHTIATSMKSPIAYSTNNQMSGTIKLQVLNLSVPMFTSAISTCTTTTTDNRKVTQPFFLVLPHVPSSTATFVPMHAFATSSSACSQARTSSCSVAPKSTLASTPLARDYKNLVCSILTKPTTVSSTKQSPPKPLIMNVNIPVSRDKSDSSSTTSQSTTEGISITLGERAKLFRFVSRKRKQSMFIPHSRDKKFTKLLGMEECLNELNGEYFSKFKSMGGKYFTKGILSNEGKKRKKVVFRGEQSVENIVEVIPSEQDVNQSTKSPVAQTTDSSITVKREFLSSMVEAGNFNFNAEVCPSSFATESRSTKNVEPKRSRNVSDETSKSSDINLHHTLNRLKRKTTSPSLLTSCMKVPKRDEPCKQRSKQIRSRNTLNPRRTARDRESKQSQKCCDMASNESESTTTYSVSHSNHLSPRKINPIVVVEKLDASKYSNFR